MFSRQLSCSAVQLWPSNDFQTVTLCLRLKYLTRLQCRGELDALQVRRGRCNSMGRRSSTNIEVVMLVWSGCRPVDSSL